MNKVVQDYIKEQKTLREKNKREAEQEKRDALLIDLGFCTTEYAPEGADISEYPYSTWSSEKQCNIYYRIIPYEITDEEYQELLELEEDEGESDESEKDGYNPIAKLMVVVAVIVFIGGIVLGIVFGKELKVTNLGRYNEESEMVFSFGIALIYWVSAFIGGCFFLGIAEIINRLDSIDSQQSSE